jgi:hypothetical protein
MEIVLGLPVLPGGMWQIVTFWPPVAVPVVVGFCSLIS